MSAAGFVDAGGRPETRRTPGYPLFLLLFAGTGFNPVMIAVVQHILAAALVGVLFFATRAFTDDTRVAFVAAALVAIDAGQIYIAHKVMTETLMSILLLGMVIALARARRRGSLALLTAGGVMLGLSALLRPAAVYLWVPLAVWVALVFPRRRLPALVVLVVAACSLPGLWTWRNYRVTGVPVLSSIGGESLYYWRAGGVLAMERSGFQYSPLPFGGEERFRHEFFRVVQRELVAESARAIAQRFGASANLSHAQRSAFEADLARAIMRDHPRATFLVTLYGILHMTFDGTWEYASAVAGGLLRDTMIWIMFIIAVASFLAAIVGFRRLSRIDRPLAWLLLITVAYFVVIMAGPEHEQWRYRIPLIPMYSVLIASAFLLRSVPFRAGHHFHADRERLDDQPLVEL